MKLKCDKTFLAVTLVLLVVGFFIFTSASMGLLARENVSFTDVAIGQGLFGLVGGLIALFITYHVPYRFWRSYAFYIFVVALVACSLVFVPGLGFSHGGATRWIDLGFTTFQPSELLKIAFIIYFAAWISGMRRRMHTWRYGVLPLVILLAISGTLLLLQPDTDTFLIIAAVGGVMFLTAGARWKHLAVLGAGGIGVLAIVALLRPYIMERLMTFLNPAANALTSSYQIQQSLIAIGSGGLFGRGFGQSIQKFNFLPEPIGDSIFAVAAEEFGFVGGVALIFLFLFFAYRGLRIATRAPDTFSRLLVVGIVILIVTQSLLNIGAMIGVVPLAGMPLLFVSHGGTALLLTLAEVGIVLQVSKHQQKRQS